MAKNVYVSEPLRAPPRVGERDLYRADLQFQGLDHSNASYEGRVFINNPKAGPRTATSPDNGYAGSYFVFGHAGCWGDAGHCDIPEGPLTDFDLRPPHELKPHTAILPVTDQVKALSDEEREQVIVTIVAVPAKSAPPLNFREVSSDVLKFERLELVTYGD